MKNSSRRYEVKIVEFIFDGPKKAVGKTLNFSGVREEKIDRVHLRLPIVQSGHNSQAESDRTIKMLH